MMRHDIMLGLRLARCCFRMDVAISIQDRGFDRCCLAHRLDGTEVLPR
jgi:hypothetical protein